MGGAAEGWRFRATLGCRMQCCDEEAEREIFEKPLKQKQNCMR
jgi:hypothetical protein